MGFFFKSSINISWPRKERRALLGDWTWDRQHYSWEEKGESERNRTPRSTQSPHLKAWLCEEAREILSICTVIHW